MAQATFDNVCRQVAIIISEVPGANSQAALALDWNQEISASGVIDSLAMIQMVHQLEEKFGIEVAADELTSENFKSIRTIATFIAGKSTSIENAEWKKTA